MVSCARATRPVRLSGWLAGLSGSSEWISSPINQTNQIDEIDHMNKHSSDARRRGQPWPFPYRKVKRTGRPSPSQPSSEISGCASAWFTMERFGDCLGIASGYAEERKGRAIRCSASLLPVA